MVDVVLENPFKLQIKHLKIATKKEGVENVWILEIETNVAQRIVKKKIEFNSVCIQATLEQNTSNEIFLVSDDTGKAKITNCKAGAAFDANWIKGVYCVITGRLVRVKGLPEVFAQTIVPVRETDSIALIRRVWPIEVQDSHLFMLGVMEPNLNEQ